jgi:deoxyhypusine monooxygenase
MAPIPDESTVASLRTTLTTESAPLSIRFRALFSLKHVACADPPTSLSNSAIEAIAAAFASPSALLKHELAYCLGQTRNLHAQSYLESVLKDKSEDPMCRHEAAEALGALGSQDSMDLLVQMRDDPSEEVVVKETCEIAVDRINWEHDKATRDAETLKTR